MSPETPATRVMAAAGAGEIFVSDAMRAALAATDVDLQDRDSHALKGAPGEWQLYALERGGAMLGHACLDRRGRGAIAASRGSAVGPRKRRHGGADHAAGQRHWMCELAQQLLEVAEGRDDGISPAFMLGLDGHEHLGRVRA
jgi:hypothetical protein